MFFAVTLIFSTNKTDCHEITEKLLKVELNTITTTTICKKKSLKHYYNINSRNYITYITYKDRTFTDRFASYIYLHLDIDSERRLRTKLFDKIDDFNFPIVNFPFRCSNNPAAPAYGVYIPYMIRHSRACDSYQDFLDGGLLLTRKLLNQGFLIVKLKSSLRQFYGRHHDLVCRYGIHVPQMTTDMFHL